MYVEDFEYEPTLAEQYRIYLNNYNDGRGNDYRTGKPLKEFDEWRGDQVGYWIN